MLENNFSEMDIYKKLYKGEISKEEAYSILKNFKRKDTKANLDNKLQLDENKIVKEEVLNKVIDIICNNLHLPKDEIRYDLSFRDMGIDSINSLEIIRDINKFFNLNLDAVVIYDYETVIKLSEHVFEKIQSNRVNLEHNITSNSKVKLELNSIDNDKVEVEHINEYYVDEGRTFDKVREIVAKNLHLPEGELEDNISFRDFGMDSINGLEIVRDINNAFGLNLDAVTIYDYSTVLELSKYVLRETNKDKDVLKTVKVNNKVQTNSESKIRDEVREVKNKIKLDNESYSSKKEEANKKISLSVLEEETYHYEEGINDKVREIVTKNLHLPEGELEDNISFRDFGMDSINGLEIVRDINNAFGLNLDAVTIYDYSTVSELSKFVLKERNKDVKILEKVKTDDKKTANNKKKIKLVQEERKESYSDVNKNSSKQKLIDPLVLKDEKNYFEEKVINKKIQLENVTPKLESNQNIQAKKKETVKLQYIEPEFSENKNETKKENEYTDDIAIVGMSGRFPGAKNIEEFWENLINNKDCVTEVPKERWNFDEYFDADSKNIYKTYNKVGGFLSDIDKFDPLFFNIPPIEAISMDPQMRIFLEESWKALEDAGYNNVDISNEKCGVFVGAAQGDYMKKLASSGKNNTGEAFTGMAPSMISARIAYYLNLIGPSITMDTACSSSLVALHLACENIKSGNSSMAIVGGVRLNTTPDLSIATSNLEILSHREVCSPFDQLADGTIMSEGIGVIVIKPLSKAIKDKNSIYGVIKSSGINQDGKTNGITAPSAQSQFRLERSVYKKGNINPEDISYVEAHGTGTKLGDPIEVKALTNAFREYTDKKQFCAIGSVKSNIGHTTNASGVIGVIKILLAMKHGKIPATIHFNVPNEHINFPDTPFYVNNKLIDWKVNNGKLKMAAISAFGFSGTNAHAVIQEFDKDGIKSRDMKLPYYLITISAKDNEAYDRKISNLLSWIKNNSSQNRLQDISYTLNVGRSHFNLRGAFIVRNIIELEDKLEEIIATGKCDNYFFSKESNINKSYETKALIDPIISNLKNGLNLSDKEYKENILNLAHYYVEKQITNCKEIFIEDDLRLIHLPTYPFEGDSYWIEENLNIEKENSNFVEVGLHPLVDKNVSTFGQESFEKVFTGREFFLRDHLVKGNMILPAVAYLEMARTAGCLANRNQRVFKISENSWTNFIQVNKEPKKVEILLSPVEEDKNVFNYEVISKVEDDRTVLHGQGKITYENDNDRNVSYEKINLNEVIQRCPNTITGERCYELFRKSGLDLGKSYQSIQKLVFNENEVLSTIELPEHLRGTFEKFVLHPTLMDGALESVIGMLSVKERKSGVRLPFYIGEVELFDDIPENCYSYAKLTGIKKIGVQEVECFDVYILDGSGKVVLKVSDFSLWEVGKEKNNYTELKDPTIYYKKYWKNVGFNESKAQTYNLKDNIVLFDKDDSLKDILKEKLQKDNTRVILVKPGKSFKEFDAKLTFEINPSDKNDYIKLFKCMESKGITYNNIAYLWSKEVSNSIDSILEEKLDMSIYGVTYLLQALHEAKSYKDIHLNYVFYEDDFSFSPLSAAISGFVKSMHLENDKYICKSIMLSSKLTMEQTADSILLEFNKELNKDIIVRYDENRERLVESLEKFELDISGTEHNNIKNNNVYVITGGTGKLGFILAQYLAEKYSAKLCLSSRSSFDAEKDMMIKKIESLGGQAIFVQSDISKFNEAKNLINTVRERFGEVNGIIHCAGINDDSYFASKNKDNMSKVLNPKILGTKYLDILTKGDKLDFFILFSSTSAITGNLGQTDYSYANSFMDYFAKLRQSLVEKGLRSGKSISFNWPLWKDGGMQISKETEELFKSKGISNLVTSKGLKAFSDGLNSNENELIVFSGEEKKISRLLGISEEKKVNLKDKQDSLDDVEIDNNIDLIQKVKDDITSIIGEILRIKAKDIYMDKSFDEYGFNSLTFTTFANKINEIYNTNLNPSVFYEYPTLRALSEYLIEKYSTNISTRYNQEEVDNKRDNEIKIPIMKEKDSSFSNNKDIKDISIKEINKISETEKTTVREPIAIIGMSGVMPQSEDLDEFWKNIEQSRDLITEIPSDRWNKDKLDKNISKWGGFMKEVDKFDPLFFGISPMEAELMDPQQRIFMQVVWKTIEDAGYKSSDLWGTKTGLFVGVSTTDYRDVLRNSEIEALTSTGNSHCILANRISYLLNIHGPSEPIDTACSSSLVAVHRGVESIYNGDCNMAIVGGVNVIASPTLNISFSKAGMLSPDGRCKTFDEKANGYVRGEGAGAILLKPLSAAIKDKDNIYAVIRGTSINHGGHATSLTAPNPNAQAEVIEESIKKANIDTNTISYIEAHGTGTKLGDPIEINGLIKAFNEINKEKNIISDKKNYCGIGSVKPNIGHLETAAGIASVLKVILAIKHNELPGNPNLNVQNPFIDLSESPFYIVKDTKKWDHLIDKTGNKIPYRAGISSFGFGGVNAHVILEEYVNNNQYATVETEPQIIPLSARNEQRLIEYAKNLYNFVNKVIEDNKVGSSEEIRLTNIAYTLQIGRNDMKERLALVVNDLPELVEKLHDFISGKKNINNLFRGTYKESADNLDLGRKNNSDKGITDILINNNDMAKLASLWVNGIKIDWIQLYKEYKPNRISLPTYPFEKRRIWRDNENDIIFTNKVVDNKVQVKNEEEIYNSFYKYQWNESKDLINKAEAKDGNVLIIVPEEYANISKKLSSYYNENQIIIIRLGNITRKVDTNQWEINVSDEGAIQNCLKDITSLDAIYFLGGLVSKYNNFIDVDNSNKIQEQGVITLFRLVKCLVNRGFDNKSIDIKICVNNVNKLNDFEKNVPCSGSILGFTKTMAKEFIYWKTSCIDVDIDELNEDKNDSIIKMLINEPANSKGDEVLIRNGKRYIRSLIPIKVEKEEHTSFRDNGVYLILGGAGGIGLEFSSYLAKNFKAKIALIGRSELTELKKKKIEQIEKLGGEVLYVRADASNLNSMKQAVSKIKERFGSIDGAVHSAIVMKDSALRNMSENDLKDALAPKVLGSEILYEVLKEEKLDFMMFFSSIQSFVGNLGQGNYAAACSFKDAFANYLISSAKFPVKIINWGYWGTVGVASTKEYNEKISKAGLISILPEEGMKAINTIVSLPELKQTIVLKAKKSLLEQEGIGTNEIAEVEEKEVLTSSATEADVKKHIKDILLSTIAEVLNVDSSEIDSDIAFSEYGIDSITGIKVIEQINKIFNISLKITVVFDYSNIDELSEYLFDEYSTEILDKLHFKLENKETKSVLSENENLDKDQAFKEIQDTVIQCVIKALKIDKSEVDLNMQFSEVGVDSITGLELIKEINNNFNIKLKNTVLFDYSNIYDLSNYIFNEYRCELMQKDICNKSNKENVDNEDIDIFEKLANGNISVEEVFEVVSNKKYI